MNIEPQVNNRRNSSGKQYSRPAARMGAGLLLAPVALATVAPAQQQNIPTQTVFQPGAVNGDFGRSVSVGEFGNTVDHDILAGDPANRNVRVYFFDPSTSTFFSTTSYSEPAIPNFGAVVASDPNPAIGDFTGDGKSEALISAPGTRVQIEDVDGPIPGTIAVFSPPSGSSASFGASAAFVRGPNGGGLAVVAVGDPDYSGTVGGTFYSQCGAVHVYFRSGTAGPFSVVTHQNPSPASGARFGAALCAADFGNDGVVDLAVGAPGDGVLATPGSVLVLNGSALTVPPSTPPSSTLPPFSPLVLPVSVGALGGSSLAYLPSTSGSVPNYLVIGSPNHATTPGLLRGRVDIISLDTAASPHPQFPSGILGGHDLTAGFRFGTSVAVTPDMDDDDGSSGLADIIVGSAGDAMHGADSGSATVFSTTTGEVIFQSYGDTAGADAGVAVAGIDVGNDGTGDLVVGIPDAINGVGLPSGAFRFHRSSQRSLRGSTHVFSAAPGVSSCTLTIDIPPGSPLIGNSYAVFGSMSGVSPGFDLFGRNMPLNFVHPVTLAPDPLFPLAGAYLAAPTGTITAGTTTVGTMTLTTGVPGIVGTNVSHAFFTWDPATGAVTSTSNAISFTVTN